MTTPSLRSKFFFIDCYGDHRDLHSFPTRRSSDLLEWPRVGHRSTHPFARVLDVERGLVGLRGGDRKSTRLNSSHVRISYAVFCLKKKNHAPFQTLEAF